MRISHYIRRALAIFLFNVHQYLSITFPSSYVLQFFKAGSLKHQATSTARGGTGRQLPADGGCEATDSGVEPGTGEDEREGGPMAGEHAGGGKPGPQIIATGLYSGCSGSL